MLRPKLEEKKTQAKTQTKTGKGGKAIPGETKEKKGASTRSSKTTPKTIPKTTPKAMSKATSKAVSKSAAAPKSQTPKATPKPTPKASKPAETPKPAPKSTPKTGTSAIPEYREQLATRLTELYGVGPVLAEALIEKLLSLKLIPRTLASLKSFTREQLRDALRDKRIYPELPAATRMDLDENPLERIPRALIEVMEREILKHAQEIGATCVVAGSYLRGAETSGDIDLVLVKSSRRDPQSTWHALRDQVNKHSKILSIREPFGIGNDKIGTALELKVPPRLRDNPYLKDALDSQFRVRFKADTFLTTPDEYDFALLFATGSGKFNIRMRALAKRKGYMLNQHGLYHVPSMRNTGAKTQRDVFRILGMQWREPAQRKI